MLLAACALAAVSGRPHDRRRRLGGAARSTSPRASSALRVVVALGSPWLAAKALAVASPAVLFARSSWVRRPCSSPAGGVEGALPRGRDRRRRRLVERARRRRDEPRSTRRARGARGDRRAIRRARARPDDRVPAVRRAPLPPPARRRRAPRSSGGGRCRCATAASSRRRSTRISLRSRRAPCASTERSSSTASPPVSRPPAEYELVWRGRYYDVWQRPAYAEQTA